MGEGQNKTMNYRRKCILCERLAVIGSNYCYTLECVEINVARAIYRQRNQLHDLGYYVGWTHRPSKRYSYYDNKHRGKDWSHDQTERNIKRDYQFQPKKRDFLISRHRLKKQETQVALNKQWSDWQTSKKQAEVYKQKYKLDEHVAEPIDNQPTSR